MENNQKNPPKLTPEQAKKLKTMLNLSKHTRWVFFASVLIGVMISILAALFKDTAGMALLICAFVVLLVTVVCAIIMFWNVRRIKSYLNSLGIKVD